MDQKNRISQDLRRKMQEQNIDVDLTLSILERINSGNYETSAVQVSEIPSIDNRTILDLTGEYTWSEAEGTVREAAREYDLPESLIADLPVQDGRITLDRRQLTEIGVHLLPFVAYGILNGGSATSYVDRTKNRSFDETLFGTYRQEFDRLERSLSGKPKGLTPAFVQPDGSSGPSFIELKMRGLLTQAAWARTLGAESEDVLFPMYQMTSVSNNTDVSDAYDTYRHSPALADLIRHTGCEITRVETGVQPMIAAFTHSSEGSPRTIFTQAHGKNGEVLPLPGGHGQCFSVLKSVFRNLEDRGKRFVQLGNVDNTGNTVNPAAVAVLALSGRPAGFDFAFRTPVDVKGGILVRDQNGNLTCGDIGPAVSKEEVFEAEQQGNQILFNCATGLFDLRYLNKNIDMIIDTIPLRVSDQNKDAGEYSQAEQITWEVISIIDEPLIFGVNKYERFLAAKLVVEMLMTSGLKIDDLGDNLSTVAQSLHNGLSQLLRTVYAMEKRPDGWVYKPVERTAQEPAFGG